MKKTYKLINLGCANCAQKMENQISKLDGVQSVKINFALSKMTIEFDENPIEKKILQNLIQAVEPECQIG